MAYYDFLLNLWLMNKLTEQQVNAAVTKGFLSQAEADIILATPKA